MSGMVAANALAYWSQRWWWWCQMTWIVLNVHKLFITLTVKTFSFNSCLRSYWTHDRWFMDLIFRRWADVDENRRQKKQQNLVISNGIFFWQHTQTHTLVSALVPWQQIQRIFLRVFTTCWNFPFWPSTSLNSCFTHFVF